MGRLSWVDCIFSKIIKSFREKVEEWIFGYVLYAKKHGQNKRQQDNWKILYNTYVQIEKAN